MIPQGIQTQATNAGAWIDTSSDLVKQIKKLEHDSEALGRVRATLVVNYGPSRATDGIVIKDHRSELSMLVDILQEYHNRIDAFTKWLDSELKDFAHPEYLEVISRVRDKFLSLK